MEGPCGSYGQTQAAQGPLGALEEGQLGPNPQQLPKLPCRLCRKRKRNDMQEARADIMEVYRRKKQCGDTGAISRKHKAYKLTCCVHTAQEEQITLP